MPNSFSQFEDFDKHREQLDIEKACLNSTKPTLVIHGDMDTSIEIEEGRNIAKWLKTRLFEIEEGEHTFGASQPWLEKEMPEHLQKVCALMIGFFEINY
jgi:pimeloyl-ACP methyl ester carboxylesterase